MDDCWESMGWKNYTLSFINILWPQQMLFQRQHFQMHFPQWFIYQIDMYKISLLSQNCPAVAQLVVIMRTSFATNDNKVGMVVSHFTLVSPGGRFKNAYELLNLRALKISMLYKSHIFQCMGKIFCVEFQRVPLKLHTKYLTHTLKDKYFTKHWNFKSS